MNSLDYEQLLKDQREKQIEPAVHDIAKLVPEDQYMLHFNSLTALDEALDLGAEFFRWEYATAVAGLLLNINPFDQPNVEMAKKQARAAIATYAETPKALA